MSPQALSAGVADVDALVCLLTDQIDASVIDASRELRIIANVAVGYNNIDLERARARGIVVTNTPDVLSVGSRLSLRSAGMTAREFGRKRRP